MFARTRAAAAAHGIDVKVCACENPDLAQRLMRDKRGMDAPLDGGRSAATLLRLGATPL